MAEACVSLGQDEVSCPLCLDVLTEPVTAPCGHSYCKVCITDCWDRRSPMEPVTCPLCRRTFSHRPEVSKNTILTDIIEKLKKATPEPPPPPPPGVGRSAEGAESVECDCCSQVKHRAVRSCLVCLASFCEAHVQPHYDSAAFRTHTLVPASGRLGGQICPDHGKLLDVYCRTEQRCICTSCPLQGHRGHDTVSAAAERADRQKQLLQIQRTCSLQVQHRETQLMNLRVSTNAHTRSAESAVDRVRRICAELTDSIQRKCSEVTEQIREQERAALSRTTEISETLQQELTALRRRGAELEELSLTEDHIHFLQTFPSLLTSAPAEAFSSPVSPRPCYHEAVSSLLQIKHRVEEIVSGAELPVLNSAALWICETCSVDNKPSEKRCVGCGTLRHLQDAPSGQNTKRRRSLGSGLQGRSSSSSSGPPPAVQSVVPSVLPDSVSAVDSVLSVPVSGPRTKEELQQYSCLLTLDRNTAFRYLRLSENDSVVTHGNELQQYPDHAQRFDDVVQVLCREGQHGRCYFEVEWAGLRGVSVALSYQSISRKGGGNECKFGRNLHSWRLVCSPSIFLFRHNNIDTKLPTIPSSSRIGVYVDHRAGTLCFYAVSDVATLLHSVQTSFTHILHPGFVLGFGSTLKLCQCNS